MHRSAYTSLELDAKALEAGKVSPEQLANLGLAIMVRLSAGRQPSGEEGDDESSVTRTYPGFPSVKKNREP
jgi:hypothetical protein